MSTLTEIVTGVTVQHRFVKLGATSEAAAIPTTLWYQTGNPTAGTANTAGINGEAVVGDSFGNITGMFLLTQPKTADGVNYITRIEMAASPGVTEVIVADRLWQNSGINTATTTLQAITSAAFPRRCPNPTGDGTWNISGHSAMAAIEVRIVTTNASAINNVLLSYTNSDGVSGRTGVIPVFPATATAQTFMPFTLASGDKGIKSIEGITLGTAMGGTIHLVAYRPIFSFGLPYNGQYANFDALSLGGACFPSGGVPFVFHIPSSTTAQTFHGSIEFATLN